MHLFDITNSYDTVYNWFGILKTQKNIETIGYVIMPNHVHCILYFPDENFDLNMLLSNGKRFMAYEIVNRLQQQDQKDILATLQNALTEREKRKGQLHKVFKNSFDAKAIFSERFLLQKLQYIHNNPVSGKWNLAEDYTLYEHSSASFYEDGTIQHFKPKNFAYL
jgi:REP element-mobilizing transposase RayT